MKRVRIQVLAKIRILKAHLKYPNNQSRILFNIHLLAMATYASTTNPFIEPNETQQSSLIPNHQEPSGQRDSQRQYRKSTPGMARPQKSLDELNRQQKAKNEDDLLLDEAPSKPGEHTLDSIDTSLDDNNNNTISMSNLQAGVTLEATGEQVGDTEAGLKDTPPSTAEATNMATTTLLVDEDVELEIGRTCTRLVEQAARLSVLDRLAPVDEEKDGLEPTSGSIVSPPAPNDEDPANSPETPCQNLVVTPAKRMQVVVNDDGDDDDEDDGDEDKVLADGSNGSASDKIGPSKSGRPQMESTSRQHQHIELMKKLRLQLRDLERYAYERGELEQVPPSILAERQSVILDKLRKRLSLNLDKDKIEKLELEELKKQVDEEINQLIDPLITKEHLLNQLKTQLTDLERYISHLHGAIGKSPTDKNADCSCSLHGCSSSISSSSVSSSASSTYSHSPAANNNHDLSRSVLNSDTLPKTSRLIRGLMAQLICSDIKIQEAMKLEGELIKERKGLKGLGSEDFSKKKATSGRSTTVTTKPPQFHDGAAWTLHIDRVILSTDSLTNLFSLTPKKKQNGNELIGRQATTATQQHQVDESLVESVVRRQLVPAMKDLLAYGLIDPSSMPTRSSYVSYLIDPYYLLTSFSCLPGSHVKSDTNDQASLPPEKVHIWNIIEDYYESRNEVNFRTSSVKTLSQSFNLTPSMEGPIKITSKQALLIAIDDIIGRLAKRKPNGPESHFKLFVYTALNQGKLSTWTRIIFRNKSILKKYYHDFSFVNQPDKMDKFLATIEALSQFTFNIDTDTESTDQFVSAF